MDTNNILVKDLYRNMNSYEGKTIQVSGWVKTIRDSKNFGFIELNDGTFFKNVQIVFDQELENFEEVKKLSISSSIQVMGEVVKTENAKQPFEIKAQKVEIINQASLDYPLQKKRHSFEYLRTISHLRPRTNTFNAVFRVRSILSLRFINSFKKKDLSMFIHQLLREVIVKVQAKCFVLHLLI